MQAANQGCANVTCSHGAASDAASAGALPGASDGYWYQLAQSTTAVQQLLVQVEQATAVLTGVHSGHALDAQRWETGLQRAQATYRKQRP